MVIILGSRQQKLKRKPNHITTLSTPQMYIMHMLSTCTAHVLQQCLTCILDLTTSVGNMAVQKQQPAIPPANVSRHGPIHCKQTWIETTSTKVCWKWWDGQVKVKIQLSLLINCKQGATGRSWESWMAPAEASGPGFDCKQLVTFHSPFICLVTLKYRNLQLRQMFQDNKHHWCRKWMLRVIYNN